MDGQCCHEYDTPLNVASEYKSDKGPFSTKFNLAESALPDCPADYFAYNFDNCFGAVTHPDGTRIVGEWKGDKLHGQGTFIRTDGFKYVGEWKNGEHHGQGTYTSDGTNPKFPYVTKYIGEWRSGEKNGIGAYSHPSFKYVGGWRDGKHHGQGTFTHIDGSRLSGYFIDGEHVPFICDDMGLGRGTSQHRKCVTKLRDSVME